MKKPDWYVQSIADLDRYEGFREFAYPDPLSKLGQRYRSRKYNWGFMPGDILLVKYGEKEEDGRPWTVGAGFTKGVTPSSRMSKSQSDRRLEAEMVEHIKILDKLTPNWPSMPLFVQTVLINLAYNLGMRNLSKFAPTLALFRAGKWTEAAQRLQKTAWYKQTGIRGRELVQRLLNRGIEPQNRVALQPDFSDVVSHVDTVPAKEIS
jgi:GH24 family phage-related lysozyme (muramidase)